MKLPQPFYRLPHRFDSQRLCDEVEALGDAWQPHPQGHPGNTAVPLVAVRGDVNDASADGPMQPTPYLDRCSYLREVLAALQVPVGRTRLMRIDGGAQATPHVDLNYYWSQRVRVHIPVVTHAAVRFICGPANVHMAAGETWIFDTWRQHNVINPDARPRTHLVVDTVGSAPFWSAVFTGKLETTAPTADIVFEQVNAPEVMSPWEMQHLVDVVLAARLTPNSPASVAFEACQQRLLYAWRALWAQHADRPTGDAAYAAALTAWHAAMVPLAGQVKLTNDLDAVVQANAWLGAALRRPGKTPGHGAVSAAAPAASQLSPTPTTAQAPAAKSRPERFTDPVFIVAAPRSGSSFLFETLARSPDLYTVGGESHAIIEGIAGLAPAAQHFTSNRLLAAAATPAVVDVLHERFFASLRDCDGHKPRGAPVRMLEKTPKNALRIPFLAAAFPNARFIFLWRRAEESVASLMESWQSGRFVTYPTLPGWDGLPWSHLLIPGWQALRGKPLQDIAAAQWRTANETIVNDLSVLPPERWCSVHYADLTADLNGVCERLAAFMQVRWERVGTPASLPWSQHTVTPPNPLKWQRHADAIAPVLPALAHLHGRLAGLRDDRNGGAPLPAPTQVATPASSPSVAPVAPPDPAPNAQSAAVAAPQAEEPLRSVHTQGLETLFRELRIALFVSTYQAGKLVLVRSVGSALNTHFRGFKKPMGVALRPGWLAVGSAVGVSIFNNVPAATRKMDPPDRHDGCFLPRHHYITGDMQIHDVAWAGAELWCVNTAFSCLCTLDRENSFVPRWRPSFISGLSPEDRCHLNGLAIRDGAPRYVTALGRSDTAQGWRPDKAHGGLLIDVPSHEVIASGLCMPHSPRWYGGRLWLLNSGVGGFGYVDVQTGRYEEVARLPGFTRGLDFAGRYAFIGLSQVRESNMFGALPVSQLPLSERACGVWVVDLGTGAVLGFLKFVDAVQEIFAVQVGHDMVFPDLIDNDHPLIANSYVLPDAALRAVPAKLRGAADAAGPTST